MRIDADTAANAVTATRECVDQIIDRGWVARDGDVFAWRSGVPVPAFNRFLVQGPDSLDAAPHPPGFLAARSRLRPRPSRLRLGGLLTR
jgi:hypothetical protein